MKERIGDIGSLRRLLFRFISHEMLLIFGAQERFFADFDEAADLKYRTLRYANAAFILSRFISLMLGAFTIKIIFS